MEHKVKLLERQLELKKRNNNQLVFNTYHKATGKYPDAILLFHSEPGFQYTSSVFRKKLVNQGITQSMSGVGQCINNGPMEGFWGNYQFRNVLS